MTQIHVEKSKSNLKNKKMYHFRMCQLLFKITDKYAERRNLTHSAIIRNSIKYCYNMGVKLNSLDVPMLLTELMKKLGIEVQNAELEIINCTRPDARIKLYQGLSFQLDNETSEYLQKYISQKELTGGLPRAEILRRAILYYINTRLDVNGGNSQ